jgi:hypothetical protein
MIDNSFAVPQSARFDLGEMKEIQGIPNAMMMLIVKFVGISFFTRSFQVSLLLLMFLPCSIYSQQAIDTPMTSKKPHFINSGNALDSSKCKQRIYMPDTSEQALVKEFRDMMDNSETVMDAQVISMESKWNTSKDEMFPNGMKSIYTMVKFKVLHWIKGSLASDEIIFNIRGGTIGDTVVTVTQTPIFSLNERGIFFCQNKETNTFLISKGRITIFGSGKGRHGIIEVGVDQVDAEDYIEIVKQAVTDTTAYPKFVHSLKILEEEYRLRSLLWKNGAMPRAVADSVHRALKPRRVINSDTTKGGVK